MTQARDHEDKETWHYATDAEKCVKMQNKYKWVLLRVDTLDEEKLSFNDILKVRCVFEGEASFPNYFREDE
jgi:hypothetical protein